MVWDLLLVMNQNKQFSLKSKLFFYYLLIQIILFGLFTFLLIHMLNESVRNKLETNLKVIILDIKDDMLDHDGGAYKFSLNKEIEEFQIKPLYIRVTTNANVSATADFPQDIVFQKSFLNSLKNEHIYFETINERLISLLKFELDKENVIIEVATKPQKLSEIFPNLKYILIFIVPVFLLVSVVLGNLLIGRTFRPIELLLDQISSIKAKNLSQRVTVHNPNDELGQITLQINQLLDRLETSYNQVAQFTSDASHELKTPLTILRGEVEVALRDKRDSNEYKHTLEVVLSEILNIQGMVENLLLLAKVENIQELTNKEIVYVDEVLSDVVTELKVLASKKHITLNLEIKDPLSQLGNPSLIKIIFKNIIENSIFYSEDNSKVNITLFNETNQAYVVIEDFGIGMEQATLKNIFEKFYRADSSRAKHTGGTGLGMSLVQKIAAIHDIEVSITSQKSIGTKVTLKFTNSENLFNNL